jgi:hypothetical protein
MWEMRKEMLESGLQDSRSRDCGEWAKKIMPTHFRTVTTDLIRHNTSSLLTSSFSSRNILYPGPVSILSYPTPLTSLTERA